MKANHIGGAWVEGEETAPNVNPSNLADVLDVSAQASATPREQGSYARPFHTTVKTAYVASRGRAGEER
jgi:hypothetical protein